MVADAERQRMFMFLMELAMTYPICAESTSSRESGRVPRAHPAVPRRSNRVLRVEELRDRQLPHRHAQRTDLRGRIGLQVRATF